MKTSLILLICIFSFPILLSSQDLNYSVNELLTSNYFRTISAPNTGEYTGSPYDHDDFIRGALIMVTKQTFKDVPLRLNIFHNDIEFKSDKEQVYVLENPELFEYITIGESKIKYLPYSILKKVSKGYFKIVEEGEATLLVKPRVVFQEATQPGAYKEATPASFKRMSDEIFIKVDGREAQLVTNKKSLEEILSKKQDKITGFLKEHKIKFSDPGDILRVVKFYNSN